MGPHVLINIFNCHHYSKMMDQARKTKTVLLRTQDYTEFRHLDFNLRGMKTAIILKRHMHAYKA